MATQTGGKPRNAGKGVAGHKSPKRAAGEAEAAAKPEPKTVECRGRTYNLPDSLPETMIFDIVEIEAAEGTDNPVPIFRLVRGILGPDQFGVLRNGFEGAPAAEIGEGMAALVEEIFAVYGVTPGES